MKLLKKLLLIMSFLSFMGVSFGAYLDDAFWATNPSDAQIIERVYGSESSYDDNWTSSCTTGAVSVVHVASWSAFEILWTLSTDNRIYVLWSWIHNITNTKYIFWQCIAVVWERWYATINSSVNMPEQLWLYWLSTRVVVDWVTIDWENYSWSTHAKNTYCIDINTSNDAFTDSTINNTILRWCVNWLFMYWENVWYITRISILNSEVYWNTTAWIKISAGSIWHSSWNIISWNLIYSNGIWMSFVWSPDHNIVTRNILSWNILWIQWSWVNNTIDSNTFTNNISDGYTGTNANPTSWPTPIWWGLACSVLSWCSCTPRSIDILYGMMCRDSYSVVNS